jgi:16S rRNA (cytosine967-C5)-methyltransferase
VSAQARLLDALWTTVAPGGLLLYATCSTLRCENERQVADFLARTDDAGLADDMRQIMPGELDMDGFFYAPLTKRRGVGVQPGESSQVRVEP